jgi:hypothetical protein
VRNGRKPWHAGIEPDLVKSGLKSYLQSDFKKALKYVDWRHKDVAKALTEVDLTAWA